MKQITAKFNSVCSETNRKLVKGSAIYYDYSTRKAYHPESEKVSKYLNNVESDSIKAYIEAQENAYFDKFNY